MLLPCDQMFFLMKLGAHMVLHDHPRVGLRGIYEPQKAEKVIREQFIVPNKCSIVVIAIIIV
ncbi:hypothetical protein M514_16644 [Trichuris suis]|uniref:Uncharacterized protein n=1 Tax=Trichuris suis TaxID=68888 RepID=A0A085NPA1_9BILA|nr:hypothetical protein M514_16644 [Trichuris suis]